MTMPKIRPLDRKIESKEVICNREELKIVRRYLHRIWNGRHFAAEIWSTQAETKVWAFVSMNKAGFAAIAPSEALAKQLAVDLRSRP